ncbi:MAG: DNA polymerase III subunit beta, partial [Bacteroidetes bacterium]|nr:DNA polymerase III subunit beta [Bacteroidota bacterium]
MKFIISSSYLKDHLQILGGVISTNNTLPILDHILFDLKEQSLKLIASDLETTISAELEVDSTDSGLIALPAKLLLDTLITF